MTPFLDNRAHKRREKYRNYHSRFKSWANWFLEAAVARR
jgi:hypothetical protein